MKFTGLRGLGHRVDDDARCRQIFGNIPHMSMVSEGDNLGGSAKFRQNVQQRRDALLVARHEQIVRDERERLILSTKSFDRRDAQGEKQLVSGRLAQTLQSAFAPVTTLSNRHRLSRIPIIDRDTLNWIRSSASDPSEQFTGPSDHRVLVFILIASYRALQEPSGDFKTQPALDMTARCKFACNSGPLRGGFRVQ